jgi:hypothetical protein
VQFCPALQHPQLPQRQIRSSSISPRLVGQIVREPAPWEQLPVRHGRWWGRGRRSQQSSRPVRRERTDIALKGATLESLSNRKLRTSERDCDGVVLHLPFCEVICRLKGLWKGNEKIFASEPRNESTKSSRSPQTMDRASKQLVTCYLQGQKLEFGWGTTQNHQLPLRKT